MNTSPQIFHGEWWVPSKADPDNNIFMQLPEGFENKYTGTLTYYGDADTTLELYHVLSNFHSKHYKYNNVMWGRDANGHIFTLFNVVMKDQPLSDFTNTKFEVGLILIGEHVLYTEDTRFNRCVVQFPYLRNWAFHNNITSSNAGTSVYFKTPFEKEKLLETLNEEGVWWRLWQCQSVERNVHDLTIRQTTEFEIEALKALPIWSYFNQIEEFAQFLSIALYGDQNPTQIKFINKENKHESFILIKKNASVNPGTSSLIKYGLLKEKLTKMLNIWHSNFKNIAPISSYLIDSLQKKNRFDVPDFLIIAQALDGYHKRFINKKDGKDIRKYEEQIEILLDQFKSVKAIKACKINPVVLKDTRHKYSHLYPDDEESLAVDGDDLYWLTEKCKILLTCCILNMLGLTNKEINICCESCSPIKQIIDSFPLEID